MIPRLHIEQSLSVGAMITLPESERNRLIRTLRLHRGAEVIVFNGEDGEWRATLDDAGPPLRLAVVTFLGRGRDSALAVTLVVGLTKSGSIELAVQKGVEVGAACVIPLLSRYGVSRPNMQQSENKMRRLQRIAVEAAQQCGRTQLPVIHAPVEWPQLSTLLPEGDRLLFWEAAGHQGARLRDLPAPEGAVTVLVGPEGGLTADEVQFACEQLGFVLVTLGPRILRAETAAMVAVSACQLLWGDMG